MKDSFLLYTSLWEPVKELPREQKGELLEAIFNYQLGNEMLDVSPPVKMAMGFLKNQFQRDKVKYQNICLRNTENIKKRWDTKNTTGKSGMPKNTRNTRNTDTDTDTDSDNDNTYIKESGKPLSREKKGFIRPTLEEFQGYCSNELMDYNLDSENIFRAYDEADWHDSRGNKILNWKQKIRQVWCNDSSRKKEDAEISALKAMIVLPREDEDERLTKMGFNL